MKEKFEPTKKKQLLISATALAAGFIVIVVGSSLLSGDAQKQKELKQLEMPKVKYIDSDKIEKDSFKETYGKELTSIQQKQIETEKQLKELIRVLDEKNKKEFDKKNEQFTNNNSSNNMLNGLDIGIPPLETIENNLNSQQNETTEASKIEIKVEDNLLVVDNNIQNSEDNDLIQNKEQQKEKKKRKITIPAGSFAKATLLNGLDAPANANAKNEPHPVILRITHNANLPNKYKADIKECRATAGGYGELSSERAIIRVENLICIANDGTTYESKGEVVGFVTGEDGKIGLSGRVVTKQGAILARTMAAGFVEGMGQVFKESSSSVNTSGLGVTSTIDPNKATQVGIYSGVGEGAKKLSEYYLKLNDQMFSIIEINVGRQGDVMFNKTVVLEEISEGEN
jgi:conjugal transfer pilus assembly protein TraB